MIFGISTLEFDEMQKIVQNKKEIEFGTKMSYLGILGCKFEKVLSYLKSTSTSLSNAKFRAKSKTLIFGTKNT